MDQFLKDQIINSIKFIPTNIVKSYFIKDLSEEKAIRKKHGFIRGACHVNDNHEQIKGANIEWVRTDIPFPFNKDGTVNPKYTEAKEKCRHFHESGLKIMAITAYPANCLDAGVDSRTKEGEEKLRTASRFMIEDIQGYIDGLQITNEMGMPRFTVPYTLEEAIHFIGIQLEEMHPLRKDIIIGYNSAGPQVDLHLGLKPYHKYCDYVGLDMYLGCFFSLPGFFFLFDIMARFLWTFTGKPILMQEFGYMSEGKPKTRAEKKAILQGYGFASEKEAKKDIVRFVENLPEHFREHVKYVCENNPELYTDFMFRGDMTNHLYKELPAITIIPGCPHTPEGQAKFYRKVLKLFYNLDFICGAIVFNYTDYDKCAYCGQSDCPTETRWGLVDVNGKPKPSYYAVKELYGEFIEKDKSYK